MFRNFGEGHDRFAFPEGILRVTAGHGGESILIIGSEKTALMDCGMSYCGEDLIKNIYIALQGRTLDYVFMSHTHYDHIGALPYVRRAFPKVTTFGAAHGQKILKRTGALRLMRKLGETARDSYIPGSHRGILTSGMAVDQVLKEGDTVTLGDSRMVALETGGHTDCSMTYVLEPLGLMFISESTGVLESSDYVHTAILKSYKDAMDSISKCRDYGANYIFSSHYGMLPQCFNETYWELVDEQSKKERDFVKALYDQGARYEEIFKIYVEEYWKEERQSEQPKEAFLINAEHIVKAMIRSVEG